VSVTVRGKDAPRRGVWLQSVYKQRHGAPLPNADPLQYCTISISCSSRVARRAWGKKTSVLMYNQVIGDGSVPPKIQKCEQLIEIL
jgi:hypothetical protein